MTESRLTTTDNPFDPFEDFIAWRLFDMEQGYYTSERLARFVNLSDEMTQKEECEEIERAIDEFIAINPLTIYRKVTKQLQHTS